ncbi:hypothetical protein K0U07_02230 [bacterium]|nr:hypothetical protein [bacterium]
MKNLRRLFTLFLFAGSTCAVNLHAAESNNEKKGKTQHPVPPAQYPNEEGTRNFSIGAAYTYWVPYQEGMILAVGGNNTTVAGDTITPAVSAQSGFKVFGSTNCYHDGWVAHLGYTWFYNPTNLRANTLIDNVTYTATFNNDSVTYSSINSQFGNQFNRIHASVDRAFFAGHYLAIRPWMGLLAAFEEQHLVYVGTHSVGDGSYDGFHMSQNWWGIGPYGGTEATYYFAPDWGLRVYSGLSMLYAEHKARYKNFTVTSSQTSEAVNNSLALYWGVEPMLEVGLSICWEGNWTDWGLALDIGWELQTYFDHNPFQGYYSGVGIAGNYSMQGLTVSARVSF